MPFPATDKRDAAMREANRLRMASFREPSVTRAANRQIALFEEMAEDYRAGAEAEALERARADDAANQRSFFG